MNFKYYIPVMILFGFVVYTGQKTIKTYNQLNTIKSHVNSLKIRLEDETKAILDLWYIKLTKKPINKWLESGKSLLHINANNADSMSIVYLGKKLPFNRSPGKTTLIKTYQDDLKINSILKTIINEKYDGQMLCCSQRYFFQPSTEDSLYFGINSICINQDEKYSILINNLKIPYGDIITFHKEDSLEIEITFLQLNLHTDYSIDTATQVETLVWDDNHYVRVK